MYRNQGNFYLSNCPLKIIREITKKDVENTAAILRRILLAKLSIKAATFTYAGALLTLKNTVFSSSFSLLSVKGLGNVDKTFRGSLEDFGR